MKLSKQAVLVLFTIVAGCGGQKDGTSFTESVGDQIYNWGTLTHPGACLDAAGMGTGNGTQIQEWWCNGSGAQSFALQAAPNGAFNLINTHANKCVDVSGSGTANGTKVQLWSCTGGGNQQWALA